jgi:hypothetical protein
MLQAVKIRTLTHLNSLLDDETTWRKRELITLRQLVTNCRDHERIALVRAAICVLYAHWEGLIKNTATAYLHYVSKQRLKLSDLRANLVALGVRAELRAAENTSRIAAHVTVTTLLMSGLQRGANLPWEDVIDTKSNLNSEVLREIVCMLGLDYTRYITKELLIDGKLLYYRNKIAHGDPEEVGLADYSILHTEIIGLMDQFRRDVENAAAMRAYLRT